MTALGEAVISGCAFGGRPTTPASPRRSVADRRLKPASSLQYFKTRRQRLRLGCEAGHRGAHHARSTIFASAKLETVGCRHTCQYGFKAITMTLQELREQTAALAREAQTERQLFVNALQSMDYEQALASQIKLDRLESELSVIQDDISASPRRLARPVVFKTAASGRA
jgi:uncharacterized protein YhaN